MTARISRPFFWIISKLKLSILYFVPLYRQELHVDSPAQLFQICIRGGWFSVAAWWHDVETMMPSHRRKPIFMCHLVNICSWDSGTHIHIWNLRCSRCFPLYQTMIFQQAANDSWLGKSDCCFFGAQAEYSSVQTSWTQHCIVAPEGRGIRSAVQIWLFVDVNYGWATNLNQNLPLNAFFLKGISSTRTCSYVISSPAFRFYSRSVVFQRHCHVS